MTHKYSLRRFLRSVLERLRHIIHITKECIAPQERNRYDTSNVRNRNMSKITLNDVTNINSITTINENFDKLEQELQNKVLYRNNPVGEPNAMLRDIDMNGFSLLNVSKVYTEEGTWASAAEVLAVQTAVEADRAEVAANKDIVVAAKDTTITNANIVASLYDQFDDRYLGAKASDPSVDNDGNSLVQGALYFNTGGTPQMKVYNGSAWQAVATFNTTTTTSIDASLYPSQLEAEQGTNNTKVLTPLRAAQAIAANTGIVHRTGDETIAGIKTFSSPPIGVGGTLVKVTKYSTAGSYSFVPDSKTKRVLVDAIGGGGTSAGAVACAAGYYSYGLPGGSGSRIKALIESNCSGATIVVGSGSVATVGSAGSRGGSSYLQGAASAFFVIAEGGKPGLASSTFNTFPAILDVYSAEDAAKPSTAGTLPASSVVIETVDGCLPAIGVAQTSTNWFVPEQPTVGTFSSPMMFVSNTTLGVRWGSPYTAQSKGPGAGGPGVCNSTPSTYAPVAGNDGQVIVYEYS